jgi:hypothetical protein
MSTANCRKPGANNLKRLRAWQVNPASDTNLYAYDSASHTYDSAVDTYDGIVSGQEFNDIKTPTTWRSL